jgi:hypothetical protein
MYMHAMKLEEGETGLMSPRSMSSLLPCGRQTRQVCDGVMATVASAAQRDEKSEPAIGTRRPPVRSCRRRHATLRDAPRTTRRSAMTKNRPARLPRLLTASSPRGVSSDPRGASPTFSPPRCLLLARSFVFPRPVPPHVRPSNSPAGPVNTRPAPPVTC